MQQGKRLLLTHRSLLSHFPIQHGEIFEHLDLGLCCVQCQCTNRANGPCNNHKVIWSHVPKQMLLLPLPRVACNILLSQRVRGSRDLTDKPYGTCTYKAVCFEMHCLGTGWPNNCVLHKHRIALIWWEVWIKCRLQLSPSAMSIQPIPHLYQQPGVPAPAHPHPLTLPL